MRDYVKLMDRLLELPAYALVTTGRTGTDFFQSLLDSHPQVLMFNGSLFFHLFWRTSVCVGGGNFEVDDLIDEFVGKYILKLKSKYDMLERKDQLGDNYDQSINIDLAIFKSEVVKFLKGRKVDSRHCLLAIYAAYAICLGQDIEKKTILFHHIHHFEGLTDFLRDFPHSRIICMTRDPRANFVSGIEHWRKFEPSTDQGQHLYYYIKRILADSTVLADYGKGYIAIKIEDLGKGDALIAVARWLGIEYLESMKESTWGGMRWHGDRVSDKKNTEPGWSGKMLDNKWNNKLNIVDKYVLNYIMYDRLNHYGYPCKKINIIDALIVPFLILLPISYELRFFSLEYMADCIRGRKYSKIARNIVFYPMRVCLFLNYYLKTTLHKGFNQPFLRCG